MRAALYLLVVISLVGMTAVLTRPGPTAFDTMLEEAIRDKLAHTDIEAGGEALPTIALAACKLRPSDCVGLVRQAIDVEFRERLFITRFTVEGFGQTATCTGAFTRIFCDRSLSE